MNRYGWTYSVGLMSRSYKVLVLAMASHLAQMIFLSLVETPHIEKLYGGSSTKETMKDVKESNIFIIKNFDPYRG